MYKFLAEFLKLLRMRYKPGFVGYKIVFQGPSSMKICLTLPVPIAPDMAKRLLSFSVDGGESISQELGFNAVLSDVFEAKRGSKVKGTLIDCDTSRNQSDPREFLIEVLDNVAPPMPGQVSFKVLDEVDAAPVEPPAPPAPPAPVVEESAPVVQAKK